MTGDADAAVAAQERTEKVMTVSPQTEAGKYYAQELAEMLAPLAQAITDLQTHLGDGSFELGGGETTGARRR